LHGNLIALNRLLEEIEKLRDDGKDIVGFYILDVFGTCHYYHHITFAQSIGMIYKYFQKSFKYLIIQIVKDDRAFIWPNFCGDADISVEHIYVA